MKELSKIGITILTLSVCIMVLMVLGACRQSAYPQNAANNLQSNENSNQGKEKQKSEDETAPCLRADRPKPKYIVSFGVINGKAIDIPKPEYPEAAKAARISGEVKVQVIIDENGNVIWARFQTGHPLLQIAVKKVVCQARFKPQILSGRPVAVNGIITYKFVLP
jgi:TonB family protein